MINDIKVGKKVFVETPFCDNGYFLSERNLNNDYWIEERKIIKVTNCCIVLDNNRVYPNNGKYFYNTKKELIEDHMKLLEKGIEIYKVC